MNITEYFVANSNAKGDSFVKVKSTKFIIVIFLITIFFSLPVFAGTKWTITQELNKVGGHHMFYTIKSSNGLIVVDGGYPENDWYVKSVIQKSGGTVHLWIITHPHKDHAGAFLRLLNDKSIKIKNIVSLKISNSVFNGSTYYQSELFKQFYNTLKKQKHVKYVGVGSVLSFKGLKFKFYNGYASEWKTLNDKYVINKYSLVFRVSGKQKSMLFTGDISRKQANRLAKRYGKELKSDYYQVPHHGVTYEAKTLSKTVKPSVAFVDSTTQTNVSELQKYSKVVFANSRYTVSLY